MVKSAAKSQRNVGEFDNAGDWSPCVAGKTAAIVLTHCCPFLTGARALPYVAFPFRCLRPCGVFGSTSSHGFVVNSVSIGCMAVLKCCG